MNTCAAARASPRTAPTSSDSRSGCSARWRCRSRCSRCAVICTTTTWRSRSWCRCSLAAVLGGRLAGALVGDRGRAVLRLLLHPAVPVAAHRERQRHRELRSCSLVVALIAAEVGIRARRGEPLGARVALRSRSPATASSSSRPAAATSKTSCRRPAPSSSASSASSTARSRPARRHRRSPTSAIHGAIEGAPLVATHTDFLLPPGGVELPVVGRGHRVRPARAVRVGVGARAAPEATRRGRDRRRARHHARDQPVG